jgi:hypothetical protein
LLDDETKKYVQQTELKDFYEILWPSLYYIPSNGEGELQKFTHLFTPAVNFWNAFNHTPYSEHYFKFLELIVSSTIKTFENIGLTEKCIGYLRGQIRNHGLELKTPELLKSYCR